MLMNKCTRRLKANKLRVYVFIQADAQMAQKLILHPSQSSCRVKGMLCQENMEFWMRFSIRLGVGFQNDVTLFGTGWLHYFGHGIVQPLPAIIELPLPSALDFFFPLHLLNNLS
jgi:hypothetical protein